jgi:hypothetical protein
MRIRHRQPPLSLDLDLSLALALRHHIESVKRDAENGNGKIDEDMERAKRRAEINDLLLGIMKNITTLVPDR